MGKNIAKRDRSFMGWFKFKSKPKSDLYEMAQNVHLERRLHPRARLPLSTPNFQGPTLSFSGHALPIWDLSEGGVCAVDEKDILRSKVGQNFVLMFHCRREFEVLAKLVATNVHKRHIQFQNPSSSFIEAIRPWIAMGLRGSWLKDMTAFKGSDDSPMRYKVFWGSILEDSLVSATDPRWDYEAYIDSVRYSLSHKIWPSYLDSGLSLSLRDFDMILTFLSNANGHELPGHQELLESLWKIRESNEV